MVIVGHLGRLCNNRFINKNVGYNFFLLEPTSPKLGKHCAIRDAIPVPCHVLRKGEKNVMNTKYPCPCISTFFSKPKPQRPLS